MSTQYNPKSYFYTEHASLADAVEGNFTTDAFGPVKESETTKYRTTSFVRLKTGIQSAKVFAICKGRILIQPIEGDDTKVNLIIKPDKSVDSLLKIKFIIYRGIKKADLINEDGFIVAKNLSDQKQPKMIQNAWDAYLSSNTSPPINFPASLVGFNPSQDSTILLETIFYEKKAEERTYQLIPVSEGEYIGNFQQQLGLDIVLDNGVYSIDDHLFKFDLAYARKKENILDIAFLNGNIKRIKRYREYIVQFLDAAAFWGSHIDCGVITTNTSKFVDINGVYSNILLKYQTKNNFYTYIHAEYGRSYNYYEEERNIIRRGGRTCKTYEWPVLITKEIQDNGDKIDVFFNFLDNTNNPNSLAVNDPSRFTVVNLLAPDNDTSEYPKSAQVNAIDISIRYKYINNQSCASFFIINCCYQEQGKKRSEEYYNYLWPAKIKNVFKDVQVLDDSVNAVSATVYRNFPGNFPSSIGGATFINNKIIFDVANSGVKRILNIGYSLSASIKEKNNIINDTAIFFRKSSYEDYCSWIYNNSRYLIFKGTITDGSTVNTLSFLDRNNLKSVVGCFQLGITEDENTTLLTALPPDADNIFYYLEKQTVFSHEFVTKYKVGLQSEIENSDKFSIQFPPSSNVFVYSTDGLNFFSSSYAAAQKFYDVFPKSNAYFRPKKGDVDKFGFDWIRKDDTSPKLDGDIKYKDNIGKYLDGSGNTMPDTEDEAKLGTFTPLSNEYISLTRNYQTILEQYDSQLNQYHIPVLTLYPPYAPPLPGKEDLDKQPIFGVNVNLDHNRVADLRLYIDNKVRPLKMDLVYDRTLLSITELNIPDFTGKRNYDLTIRCLTDFQDDIYVKVEATYAIGEKAKVIGALKVKANKSMHRFVRKLLFVEVPSMITNGDPSGGYQTVEVQANNMKKFARQVFITPFATKIVMQPASVVNLPNIYTINDSGYNYLNPVPVSQPTLMEYLYEKLKLQTEPGAPAPIGEKYSEYLVFFLLHDCGAINNGANVQRLGGISDGRRFFTDFMSNRASNGAHEFLHTLGVKHTFQNTAIHTFKYGKTENIMDYSYQSPYNITTVSFFDWQGKIAQKAEKIESETKYIK